MSVARPFLIRSLQLYELCRRHMLHANASSEKWGSEGAREIGKYAVKLYTIDGVLIYQVDNGTTNTAKVPLGGVVMQGSAASSMMSTIANPITFYGGVSSSPVINQAGHSGDLYDYYWTSYSRSTDGSQYNTKWHNAYLDGYIPLRVKSIYDPCPYLYRIPSNGTYNQFTSNQGWTDWSYLGGVSWNMNNLGESWLPGLGYRNPILGNLEYSGRSGLYFLSTAFNHLSVYGTQITSDKSLWQNRSDLLRSWGFSVRCIE